MNLDKNFKVPDGFEPVLNYREDPKNGTPVVGRARASGLEFYISDSIPKLPLKSFGKIWHMGWDIPTRYTIDTDNICWMNDAHGDPLKVVTSENLINSTEELYVKNSIMQELGIKVPAPDWAQIALKDGWLSPEGWTQ